MPTFKELKEKARKFVRRKILTEDEYRRLEKEKQDKAEDLMREAAEEAEGYDPDDDESEQVRIPEQDAEALMQEAFDEHNPSDEPVEEEKTPDRDAEDLMQEAFDGHELEEDEEDQSTLTSEQDIEIPVPKATVKIDENERSKIREERSAQRSESALKENEVFSEFGGVFEGMQENAIKEAKKKDEILEQISLKEKEIESNSETRKKLSEAEIELNEKKIKLKKQLIALKKVKQPSAELEEEIKLIDEEIKVNEEEFKYLETKTNHLSEEIKILKAELSGQNRTSGKETIAEDDATGEADTDEDENAHTTTIGKRKNKRDVEEDIDESPLDYLTDKQREGLSKSRDGVKKWRKAVEKIKENIENADEFLESRRFQQLTTEELLKIIKLQNKGEDLEWYIENLQVEITEPIAKIIEQMKKETKDSISLWDKDVWKPYTKDDLVKTLQQLGQRNSPLLKDSKSLSKLTDKRLKTLICYSKKGELEADREGGVDLIRDERVQLMMKDREDKKDMWLSRGASPEGVESHPIYKELTTLFPIGKEMKFFGEGEVNKDNIDEIEKVAKTLSTFKLFGSNPFKNFEDEIKETVRLSGGGIKTSRQMYIDTRKKINQTLSLAKKDPGVWKEKKNYDVKKYYDAWLKASGKKFGDEINVQDIDPLLLNDKYDYLNKVESEVETLLNKIWETKFSGKETGMGKDKKFELQEKELDSKNQAIVRYFSEFLEQSNEAMKPLMEKKVEEADKFEYQAMEEENKYKDNGEGENKGKRKAVRKSKSAPESSSSQAITTAWRDLRLKGRMYVGILVQFCNNRKKTIKESEKTRLSKLKERIVKQFLEKLENQFDTKGAVPLDSSQELKKFEALLEKFKEEILSTTHMSRDVFAEKIKLLEKQPQKKLKEDHYTLPEIE